MVKKFTQRRRHLHLQDVRNFTRCNPARRRTSRGTRCLPGAMYDGNTKTAIKGDHELIDGLNITDSSKAHLRSHYLRPRMPKEWKKKPDKWLTNFDIENVMGQYAEKFKWFNFKGIFPIDFSAPDPYSKSDQKVCLYPELCNINLKKDYTNGIRSIGLVFNLDPHFKGGSHWVALYIDIHKIKNPWCGYFDSYGYEPPELIARLMRTLCIQYPNIKLMYNARRFQYSNTECGMFSMYFIICMIRKIRFKDFCKTQITDSLMLELRNTLFSK